MVRSHHGAISVDRGPLGGARFDIVIGPEVDREDGSAHRIDRARVRAMTTYRALVVEDEPVAAEANAAYLRRLDVEVVAVAASGQEALRYLAGDPDVDLILLDMHLKDGHGLSRSDGSGLPGTRAT